MSEYRRLISVLASQAARMGSKDAEGAAQEALKRSLENPVSRDAVVYYLGEVLPEDLAASPVWPFGQLLAWLHGVLRRVVLEEFAKASFRREVPAGETAESDARDPSPDQLDDLIDRQLQAVVRECLSGLNADYRRVLTMRADGLKYSEIAVRLGVSENTVATWVSRGTKTVARQVREQMYALPRPARQTGYRD